jgi:hypothetical protein
MQESNVEVAGSRTRTAALGVVVPDATLHRLQS